MPARLTKQLFNIPHYAEGTGWWGNVKEGFSKAVSKVAEWTGNVFDYVKNPGKLLDVGLDLLGIEIPSVGLVGDIARGGFNLVKDYAVDFIKNAFDSFMESVSAPAGDGAHAWAPVIQKAAARMGETLTTAELNGIIAQIHRESGGNEKITQSAAVWDINMAQGNPARGLLQYIPQTFNAYKVPGHGNIYSGYDQLLAFFNNRNWRRDLPYGRSGWGPSGGRKFATGGLINTEGLYQLGEEGSEWVIPTAPNRRTEAMKLLALAGKSIQGNKRPQQLPNVNVEGDSRGEEISLLRKQVQLLTELVLSNRQIADKPVLSEGDIGRANSRYDARQNINHAIFTGRTGGV